MRRGDHVLVIPRHLMDLDRRGQGRPAERRIAVRTVGEATGGAEEGEAAGIGAGTVGAGGGLMGLEGGEETLGVGEIDAGR